MTVIVTRPGSSVAENDPMLAAAYADQDMIVAARLQAVINALHSFSNSNLSVQVLGFDPSRYLALKRDARQTVSELSRALERWRTTVNG